MRKTILHLADNAHRLTMAGCMAALMVVLVSMTATVLLRYGFSLGFLKLQDLTLYAFGVFAVLSIPCAIASSRHVRVDFIGRGNPGFFRVVDGIGLFVCLLPIAALLVVSAWPEVVSSVSILEGSAQIGGLGGRFVVKAMLPLAAVLIAVQGVARFLCEKQESE